MKKLLVTLLLVTSLSMYAQESKKWIVGFGMNFIDNTSSGDGKHLNFSNWNSTYTLSKMFAQYEVIKNFSISSELTVNNLSEKNIHNGKNIDKNLSYFGIDFNARYNTASLIKLPSKFTLEPLAGLGFSWSDTHPNQSLNVGLSVGYLIGENYGVRLQTLGKFAADQDDISNNMIQHSFELFFRF
jgi:hypothetical protein